MPADRALLRLEESELEYKHTLNLPKTSFPMKGNLPKREPEIQAKWEEMNLYQLLQEKRKEKSAFVLHDGPPYANGNIHLGTAYNKILKDVIIKYKTMEGFRCPYVPGWDCHGQPIEHEVVKRLGSAANISTIEIRERCRAYAMEFVESQTAQFKRLGVLGDFENPYLTVNPAYEARNISVFKELYLKGLIYKGRKPIHWCATCGTALAEAELEYEDKESPSIYVRFPLLGDLPELSTAGKPVSVVIWTTTPWTLPANVAVALSPDFPYVALDTGEEIFIVAKPLVERLESEIGLEHPKVLGTFDARSLEGMKCKHPWSKDSSVIVLADYVTLEQGTGCVHIAPGHGEEDYLTGLEYNLPSPMVVDDQGCFTEEAGFFAGLDVEEANPIIMSDLEKRGILVASSSITHQYPHCWRCKKPVIFRATPQWFIAMDKSDNGNSLRKVATSAIRKVEWIPEWTINRMGSMLETRPDWCISRQRSWGVPIPVLYCKKCGRGIVNRESLDAIEELIRREGSDGWFRQEPSSFLPEGFTCPHCGSVEFEKEKDILDVWFESGISHFAVLREREELKWPADIYVEGSDQHRGWFQSSLLTSIGVEGLPPFERVMTHGFVVDGEGKKMSKSIGNVINPTDVCDRYGADVLRLWAVSTNYSTDIPISEEILARTTESYRRIRNTIRFLLGNLFDFELSEEVEPQKMREIDRWMISRTQRLVSLVTSQMENWQFHQAIRTLVLFCAVDLSSLYLDILKDRLYTAPKHSSGRKSAQTAIYYILNRLLVMTAPIIAHTSEEAYLSLPEQLRESESIHLLPWPKVDETLIDEALEEKWEKLLEVREVAYREIELARKNGIVGSSLEARVKIFAGESYFDLLESYENALPEFFIVSQVEINPMEAADDQKVVKVEIEAATGEKCSRCWNYSTTVGADKRYPELCERCVSVMEDSSASED